MSSTTGQRTWAWVGKISVIVTMVGTVVGIYVSMQRPSVELDAVCTYRPYSLPPDLRNALGAVRKAGSLESLNTALKQQVDTKDSKCDIDAFSIALSTSQMLDDAWTEDFRYEPSLYSGFWYFHVRNVGSIPAQQVVLDVPVEGVALLTPESGGQSVVKCDGSLQIGALRPGNSISVALWSSIPASPYMEQDVRLTHAYGIGSVRYERTFIGWRAWVAENLGMLILMGLLILCVIALIAIIAADTGSTKQDATDEAKEST